MDSVPRLSTLAAEVSRAAEIIDNYLSESGSSHLTFSTNGKHDLNEAPKAVQDASEVVMRQSRVLLELLAGPYHRIQGMCTMHHDSAAYRWLYYFRVHEHVPLTGDISYGELAKKINADEARLRRVLRLIMTRHLYCEPRPGFVAHTIDSSIIATDSSVAGFVGYNMEETFVASTKLVEATEKFGASTESNHTAWNIAFGTELPIFDCFKQNHERAERFAKTMELAAKQGQFDIRYINSYPWKELGHGTVVDVGGSSGHASLAIAQTAPELKLVVQDLHCTKKESQSNINERVSFMKHDFFSEQPIKDAEAYLLRWVLHDHRDKAAANILRNIVAAMGQTSRVVVMDIILPEPHTLPIEQERHVRLVDMEMMTNFNSRERELEDWKLLFREADPRLKLTRVFRPKGSAMSLMEVVLD